MNNQNKSRFFIFISDIIILISLTLIWVYIFTNYYKPQMATTFWIKGDLLVYSLYAFLSFTTTHLYGGYKVGHHRKFDIFISGIFALIITNLAIYIVMVLMSTKLVSITPLVINIFISGFVIFSWAHITEAIYRKLFPPDDILMIYDGRAYATNLLNKISMRDDKYRICQALDISLSKKQDIFENILNFKSVLLSDLESEIRNDIIKFCYDKNIRTYITPKLSDIMIRTAKEIELFDSPILLNEDHDLSIEQKIFKRSVDIISSVLGIIITSPIMLLIALAIKIEDKGPVFYSQDRLTINGKIFKMIKFRSMVINADKIEGHRLASKNDPRITKVGKFIRKIRVDELPQLFNILKGEMSLVGPRPEHPDIAKEYLKDIPEFNYRLKMKAGLTGYAQVIGKYNTTPYDKLKMDLMYIKGYSMSLDLKIIMMTPKIIFKFDSTEGIEQNQKNAKLEPKNKKK